MKNGPRLFCFTHAGGKADFFNIIENDLSDVDVVKLEYSGHGVRYKEAFYVGFDELSLDMFNMIRDRIVGSYALFGYSMGAIAAVEVLVRIIEAGIRLPDHIFLAAHEPHTKSELLDFTPDEMVEWTKERTIQFGAVPAKLIHNRVYWRTYLPLYRADYTIIGKYRFENLKLLTTVPVTIFYSETDTPLKDMEEWRKYFIGATDFYCFEGKHFFLNEYHREIAEVIQQKLGVTA